MASEVLFERLLTSGIFFHFNLYFLFWFDLLVCPFSMVCVHGQNFASAIWIHMVQSQRICYNSNKVLVFWYQPGEWCVSGWHMISMQTWFLEAGPSMWESLWVSPPPLSLSFCLLHRPAWGVGYTVWWAWDTLTSTDNYPARLTIHFLVSGAHVTGLNNNAYQITRGQVSPQERHLVVFKESMKHVIL